MIVTVTVRRDACPIRTNSTQQVAHAVIVFARPFHTSKLKIDASHKHDDRRSSLRHIVYITDI